MATSAVTTSAPGTGCESSAGILAVFSRERPVLGFSEIGQRTGLSSSNTHRLVVELTEWGCCKGWARPHPLVSR